MLFNPLYMDAQSVFYTRSPARVVEAQELGHAANSLAALRFSEPIVATNTVRKKCAPLSPQEKLLSDGSSERRMR